MNNLQKYFTNEKENLKNNFADTAFQNKEHFKSILQNLPTKSPYRKHFYIISSVVSATLMALFFLSVGGNNSEVHSVKKWEDKNAVLRAIDDTNSFQEENYEEI